MKKILFILSILITANSFAVTSNTLINDSIQFESTLQGPQLDDTPDLPLVTELPSKTLLTSVTFSPTLKSSTYKKYLKERYQIRAPPIY